MAPEIPPGSVLINRDPEPDRLEEGDIITFIPRIERMDEGRVTHRIIEVREENGSLMFRTQGDANPEPDPGWTPEHRIIGVEAYTVPYAGYMVALSNTVPIYLILVLLPAALILKRELSKLFTSMEDNGELRLSDFMDFNTDDGRRDRGKR